MAHLLIKTWYRRIGRSKLNTSEANYYQEQLRNGIPAEAGPNETSRLLGSQRGFFFIFFYIFFTSSFFDLRNVIGLAAHVFFPSRWKYPRASKSAISFPLSVASGEICLRGGVVV